MAENALRKIYNFEYYNGDFQSSLTKWYNKVIDKSIDELNVTDVFRMIRQNILKDIAVYRAIELFLTDPFDGEMQDGDLLALLVSCGAEVVKSKQIEPLVAMILKLENEISDFDWANENSKLLFERNVSALKNILL